jgi:RNA polymerase subunit RPABC4/transcription elongation factor Spt4
MPLAIFGITNGGLNLVATLFVMALVVVWLALIVWTYFDASRRIEDPVLVACATAASLFPYIGTFVYSILRPPEFLDDAKERELEIKAAELRVRQLSELACPNCNYPVEKSYLRCPNCQRRLKDPCESCGKPVDPRWALCPYCETALPGRQRPTRKAETGQRKPSRGAPQRPAPRRTPAAQRSAQRTASPTAGQGKSSDDDSSPAEAPERSRAARRK